MTMQPPVLRDAQAGPLVPSYAVVGGRTRPTVQFRMVTYVKAVARSGLEQLGPEYQKILNTCTEAPLTVAEVSAFTNLPLAVTKILLSDLHGYGAIAMRDPAMGTGGASNAVLEKVLNGLRNYK
jgi:hypothetical protein